MKLPRGSVRWLLPAAIVAGTAAAVAVPSLLPAGADPVPVLPELTPAELLIKAQQADVQTFSGAVRATVDLGLPDIAGLGGSGVAPASMMELLSGTIDARVAADGKDRQRVALDGDRSETAWIHNGGDVWSWDSTTSRVVHLDLTALAAEGSHAGDPSDATEHADRARDALPALTPDAAADAFLDRVDASTEVRVQTPGYVAGRPVYELVLDPRDEASTIEDVVIAIDASTGMALRLRVDAVGADTPAVEIGFTEISYDQPDPSTFAFTPPPGAEVVQADGPGDLLPFSRFGLGGFGDRRDDRREPGDAPGGEPDTTIPDGMGMVPGGLERVGEDWATMVVVPAADVPPLVGALLAEAPTVDGPGGEAKVLRSRLVNVLLLADGRLAVAALEPAAMATRIG